MSAKPFRNGKGVNKPFRSPFRNISKNDSPGSDSSKTELKTPTSKRFLSQQTLPAKKLCLDEEETKEEDNVTQTKTLCRKDLEALKKRVNDKQQTINKMKTDLSYKRKNKMEDINADIKTWTEACQEMLTDYHKDLQERCGQMITMAQLISSFGIDHKLVRFSEEEQSFY